MAFVYHASDTESVCDEGLEFGNVALARSFGQMSPLQHVPGAQQQPRSAASQQPAELDISSLLDWDPATVTPVALHGGSGGPLGGGARQAAPGDRQGLGGAFSSASDGQPIGVPSGGVPHGRGAAARLLQQSEYVRKNSVTPPPLPAPPDWLRDRLGGESLTERYLQGGRPPLAGARKKPAPPPVMQRQLHLQQQLDLQRPSVPNGILQHPEAAPRLPAAAIQSAATAGGSAGAGAHLGAVTAQPHADWRRSDGSGGGASAARPPPSQLHQELLRFAAQVRASSLQPAWLQFFRLHAGLHALCWSAFTKSCLEAAQQRRCPVCTGGAVAAGGCRCAAGPGGDPGRGAARVARVHCHAVRLPGQSGLHGMAACMQAHPSSTIAGC